MKNRIKSKVENNIEDNKFCYRPGKETGELLLALRVVLKRGLDINRSIYKAFVDIEKAFEITLNGKDY